MLKGPTIHLRALEPEDLPFLEKVENNPEFWEISHTLTPFSNYTLSKYLEAAGRDIYEARQQRFGLELKGELIGFVDLFDFDPMHKRAGIGIVIAERRHRKMGYAREALELLCDYSFEHLGLHQLYANILEENQGSQALFKKLGFDLIGLKKDWVFYHGEFKNELLYQKIRKS